MTTQSSTKSSKSSGSINHVTVLAMDKLELQYVSPAYPPNGTSNVSSRLKMVQEQVATLEAKLATLTAELNAATKDKQEVRDHRFMRRNHSS